MLVDDADRRLEVARKLQNHDTIIEVGSLYQIVSSMKFYKVLLYMDWLRVKSLTEVLLSYFVHLDYNTARFLLCFSITSPFRLSRICITNKIRVSCSGLCGECHWCYKSEPHYHCMFLC